MPLNSGRVEVFSFFYSRKALLGYFIIVEDYFILIFVSRKIYRLTPICFTQRNKGAKKQRGMFRENEIAKTVVDISFNIHTRYGPGLYESVYEEIFCYEWLKTKIPLLRQHPVPLVHEQIKLEIGFRQILLLITK